MIALYQSCLEVMLEVCPDKLKLMMRWREEVHSRIKTKEEVKVRCCGLPLSALLYIIIFLLNVKFSYDLLIGSAVCGCPSNNLCLLPQLL